VTEADTGQAWARGARAGSAEDFSRLVRLHQQPLRAFLRRLTGNAAEADDLAQDSFVFAWEHIQRFDPARAFRPWLFGIAWRKWRESRRGWRRLLRRETAYADVRETVDAADPSLRLDLAAACATLPADQRAALLLCLGLDFTQMEAAEALSLPLGTVKSHITRGREKLAAFLGDTHA
jgi:RNA polymerase sigma-70 factor (ECF subfamily)